MSWQIVEEDSYDRAVAQMGTHENLDFALELISYGLFRNPQGFLKTAADDIYMAKTKLRFLGNQIVPSFRLWFRINEKTHTVHKLWIDIAPPEDMGLWDEEDDSPRSEEQIERFKEAARELGCDEDEAAFDAKLKKVAGHKVAPKNELHKAYKKQK